MSVDPQLRRQRVANGSRRKRDLAAAGVDPSKVGPSPHRLQSEAWIAEHMPGESHHAVEAVRYRLRKQGLPATVQVIRDGLLERGWAKEQRS